MRYGSVCSGVEAASMAWEPLGWKPQWYSEIEKFPSAVLAHRFPNVPNLGDMTKIHESEVFNGSVIDVLVGGTPCQSFSVAGLRKGLADPRGNLALVFLRILALSRARWVVWENVPGVISSWTDGAVNPKTEGLEKIRSEAERLGGIIGPKFAEFGADFSSGAFEEAHQSSDFDAFSSGLRELGYGIAWRVLDAQYFGVPQRRRRVFVVGYLGDWRRAAAVLFESASLRGDSAPSREKGEGSSERIARSVAIRGRDGTAQAELVDEVANTILTPSGGRGGIGVGAILEGTSHSLRGEGFDGSEDGTGRGIPLVPMPSSSALGFMWQSGLGISAEEEGMGTLIKNQSPAVLKPGGAVRRLTPKECERLQGFPDDWTLIPGNKSDGPRYKACGNSMAVPVMRWIGERIEMVEKIKK